MDTVDHLVSVDVDAQKGAVVKPGRVHANPTQTIAWRNNTNERITGNERGRKAAAERRLCNAGGLP